MNYQWYQRSGINALDQCSGINTSASMLQKGRLGWIKIIPNDPILILFMDSGAVIDTLKKLPI